MGSPLPVLAIIAGYYYFSTNLGQKLMKNRAAFQIKGLIAIYNVFQILWNSFVAYYVRPNVRSFLCRIKFNLYRNRTGNLLDIRPRRLQLTLRRCTLRWHTSTEKRRHCHILLLYCQSYRYAGHRFLHNAKETTARIIFTCLPPFNNGICILRCRLLPARLNKSFSKSYNYM